MASILLSNCGQEQNSQTDRGSDDVAFTENAFVQGRGEGKDNWFDNLPREHWNNYELIELPEDQDWFDGFTIIVRDPPLWEE